MNASPKLDSASRFEFGANWTAFLSTLDEERIVAAQVSLREMLRLESFEGLRFLDVGSGSGLMSLAARRLGATVHSFDFDPQSVSCTETLKRRYRPDDSRWLIEQGLTLSIAGGCCITRVRCGLALKTRSTGSLWTADFCFWRSTMIRA
jgi:hypothetical protein